VSSVYSFASKRGFPRKAVHIYTRISKKRNHRAREDSILHSSKEKEFSTRHNTQRVTVFLFVESLTRRKIYLVVFFRSDTSSLKKNQCLNLNENTQPVRVFIFPSKPQKSLFAKKREKGTLVFSTRESARALAHSPFARAFRRERL